MAAPKSRVPLIAGLALAGGAGYYLYSAGGSPKAAEKQFEADLSRASAKVKSEMPGRTDQAQKQAESYAAEAGHKVDNAVANTRAELAKAEGKFDQYRKEIGKDAMKSVDKFDATVEKKAAEAKSGISSWFGGK